MKKVTILLFDQGLPESLYSLLKRSFPPDKFLEVSQCFGFFATTNKSKRLRCVICEEIYRFSEEIAGAYVYCKKINTETGKYTYRKIGPLEPAFKTYFYQPLTDFKQVSESVLEISAHAKKLLENPKDPFSHLLIELRNSTRLQTESARKLEFELAVHYRDKRKDFMGRMCEFLNNVSSERDFSEAIGYFVDNLEALLE